MKGFKVRNIKLEINIYWKIFVLTNKQIIARMDNIMRYHNVPDAELLRRYSGLRKGLTPTISVNSEIVDVAAELLRRGYSEEAVFSQTGLGL